MAMGLLCTVQVDYEVISSTCNMFRALTDMYDSFYSVQSMIDYYSRDNYNMSAYSRPGAWNDPDQVTCQLRLLCLFLSLLCAQTYLATNL